MPPECEEFKGLPWYAKLVFAGMAGFLAIVGMVKLGVGTVCDLVLWLMDLVDGILSRLS